MPMRALVCGPSPGRSAACLLATSVALPTCRSVGACEGARGSTPSEPADPGADSAQLSGARGAARRRRADGLARRADRSAGCARPRLARPAITVAAGAVGTSSPRRDPRARGRLRSHRRRRSPSCARCADTRASRRRSRARTRVEAADGLRGVRRTRPDGASRSAQRGVAGLRGIDRVAPRLAGVERCGRASHARARARVGVGLLRKDGVCSFGSSPPPAQEA